MATVKCYCHLCKHAVFSCARVVRLLYIVCELLVRLVIVLHLLLLRIIVALKTYRHTVRI